MFYKDFHESKFHIKLNDGDYKLVYEFTGSKEYLEKVWEAIGEEIIKKYKVHTKNGCRGCKGAISKRA